MKFDCGETYEEYKTRLSNWHTKFAWWPVKVADHDCRWLEKVERKGKYCYFYDGGEWEWEYRSLTKNNT